MALRQIKICFGILDIHMLMLLMIFTTPHNIVPEMTTAAGKNIYSHFRKSSTDYFYIMNQDRKICIYR